QNDLCFFFVTCCPLLFALVRRPLARTGTAPARTSHVSQAMSEPGLRVGVYVDAESLSRNGGERMQYPVLRNIACRETGQRIRLNTYIAFDERRADNDRTYRDSMLEYYSAVRDAGFKIIEKKVQHFIDPMGIERSKANADLDMAVDCLLQSEHLDRVV